MAKSKGLEKEAWKDLRLEVLKTIYCWEDSSGEIKITLKERFILMFLPVSLISFVDVHEYTLVWCVLSVMYLEKNIF